MTLSLSALCLAGRGLFEVLDPMRERVLMDALALPEAGWSMMLLAVFLHSGWLHLLGNLAYLWVFGMPVEWRSGPWAVAAVFLAGGVLAQVILVLQLPQLQAPVIGASGAVSAVLGCYLGLIPRRRIGLYLPLGVYVQFVRMPAWLVIGSWFTLQLLYSVLSPISGAVAWWTHLAGFTVGLIAALLFRALGQLR